ncbi:hypothetical protein MANES_07G063550v8 [Manihot esculenta]|uniref:Uncharacterized protein n=1 Tax=Manihot esculenta TaxID=3983 RepID=A0ACB7HG90_MANES|nr:hypothetical protein MANES_07G063550v8 [Manihot esculenta]
MCLPSNTRGFVRRVGSKVAEQIPRPETNCFHKQRTSFDLPYHDNDKTISSSSYSIPKAQRFRIPERLSCPPIPMKRRVAPTWSSKESPITFFAPLDIEIFFFFSFRKITTLHTLQN